MRAIKIRVSTAPNIGFLIHSALVSGYAGEDIVGEEVFKVGAAFGMFEPLEDVLLWALKNAVQILGDY